MNLEYKSRGLMAKKWCLLNVKAENVCCLLPYKSAVTCECRRKVLFHKSAYFGISKIRLNFPYCFYAPSTVFSIDYFPTVLSMFRSFVINSNSIENADNQTI